MTNNLDKQARALLSENRLQEAEAAYKQLCKLEPGEAEYWAGLGLARQRLGDFTGAERDCRHALDLKPGTPLARFVLGIIRQKQGQPEEALAHYRQAVTIKPDYEEAQYFLANCLREDSRIDDAVTAYKKLLIINPGHFEGLNNLGMLLANTGKSKQAIAHLEQALKIRPISAEALTMLGRACIAESQYEKALVHLRQAIHIKPELANAHLALANAANFSGQMQEALAGYRKLGELRPGSVDAAIGQARVLELLGNHQECYTLLEPLLNADYRDAIPIFFDISKHIGQREAAVKDLERMLQTDTLGDETAAASHFRLGKHHDESGNYDQAFYHYQRANSLTSNQFDKNKLTRYVNDCISTYSREFVRQMPQAGNHSDLPLFIVGMPRTGTSLVEQIMASHPDVFGAGELPHIPEIVQRLTIKFPGYVAPLYAGNLTRSLLDGQAEQHLQALQAFGGKAARVSDKLPHNFRNIGLIAQLFPAARIINCTRHPLDTCLSCFIANFGIAAHGYANNLETMGEYYIQYHKLMTHWRSVFQDRILEVSYAQLVQGQEATSRRIINFCGLEWDDKCLDFHQSERFVFTLSYEQVRKPIYTRSLNRWKHYEKHLQPLRSLLESNGIDCS